MGYKPASHKEAKEAKAVRRATALESARMVQSNTGDSHGPTLGIMHFATACGIIAILCQRLPTRFVLTQVFAVMALLMLVSSELAARTVVSVAIKFAVTLITFALITDQDELEPFQRVGMAACSGFGTCYAGEMYVARASKTSFVELCLDSLTHGCRSNRAAHGRLVRQIREGLRLIPAPAVAAARDLERRGKEGTRAAKLAQREARALGK